MGGSLPKPGVRIRPMAAKLRPPFPPSAPTVSVAGGMPNAIARATSLGCTAAQVFVKNASPVALAGAGGRGGRGVPRRPRGERGGSAGGPRELSDQPVRHRSGPAGAVARGAGRRARALRPAGRGGAGAPSRARTWGRARRRGSSGWRRRSTRCSPGSPARPVRVLLENTAGQGSCLGHRLEHLAAIRDRVAEPERVGICLDTCHAFAAGYALHEPAGYEEMFAEIEERIGLDGPGLHAPQRLAAPLRLPARPPRPHRRGGDRPRRLRPPAPGPAPGGGPDDHRDRDRRRPGGAPAGSGDAARAGPPRAYRPAAGPAVEALHQVEPDHHEHQQQDHHEADLADDLLEAQRQVAPDHPLDHQDEDLAAVEDGDRHQVHHRDADADEAHQLEQVLEAASAPPRRSAWRSRAGRRGRPWPRAGG